MSVNMEIVETDESQLAKINQRVEPQESSAINRMRSVVSSYRGSCRYDSETIQIEEFARPSTHRIQYSRLLKNSKIVALSARLLY